jgi:hypothetical protein
MAIALTLMVSLLILSPVTEAGAKPAEDLQTGDLAVLETMRRTNELLRANGANYALAEVELFTLGLGRPANRLHKWPGARWVADDPRRTPYMPGTIAYVVDQSDGGTSSGLSNDQTETAIDSAFATWAASRCMSAVGITKTADPGWDVDFFDDLLLGDQDIGSGPGPAGEFGYPATPIADIQIAGWVAPAFFDALLPGGSSQIIAISLTFTFIDPVTGELADLNGDRYLDTALNEVYFNDRLGVPGDPIWADLPWGIDVELPGIDVESIALHESGHSFGFGHFGFPPLAAMNRGFDGIQQSLEPVDESQACAMYASWPNP